MTTFILESKNEICLMKKGFKLKNQFYHYSEIRSIRHHNIYVYFERVADENNSFKIYMSKETYEKFEPVFLEHMNNYYSGGKPKNEQLDRIEKKLDDLFYAPGFSGSLQAKASFEEKSKN